MQTNNAICNLSESRCILHFRRLWFYFISGFPDEERYIVLGPRKPLHLSSNLNLSLVCSVRPIGLCQNGLKLCDIVLHFIYIFLFKRSY